LIFQALTGHPTLTTLEIGQAYATKDLEGRYNYLTTASIPSITTFMTNTPTLRYLGLGLMDLDRSSYHNLLNTAMESPILYFEAKPLKGISVGQVQKMADSKLRHSLLRTMTARAQTEYKNPDLSYQGFLDEHLRWLRSPKDVRLIDSVYRNRDAGMARRGEKVLEKWWGDDGEVLGQVMEGRKEVKVMMCPMKAAALERGRRALEERLAREAKEAGDKGGMDAIVQGASVIKV